MVLLASYLTLAFLFSCATCLEDTQPEHVLLLDETSAIAKDFLVFKSNLRNRDGLPYGNVDEYPVVNYFIDESAQADASLIRTRLSQWEDNTCIRFHLLDAKPSSDDALIIDRTSDSEEEASYYPIRQSLLDEKASPSFRHFRNVNQEYGCAERFAESCGNITCPEGCSLTSNCHCMCPRFLENPKYEVITSARFVDSRDYPEIKTGMVWKIKGDNGSMPVVRFKKFHLKPRDQGSCWRQALKVRVQENEEVIENIYCGSDIGYEEELRLNAEELSIIAEGISSEDGNGFSFGVEFKEDLESMACTVKREEQCEARIDTRSARRPKLKYTAKGPCYCRLRHNILTWTSPGYPDNYRSNVKCTVDIEEKEATSYTIRFDDVKMEVANCCLKDFVYIDIPDAWHKYRVCGRSWEAFELPGMKPSMRLVFKSNEERNFKGFKMHIIPKK